MTPVCPLDTARHPAGTADPSAVLIDETAVGLGQAAVLAHPANTIGNRISAGLDHVKVLKISPTIINEILSLFTPIYMIAAQ